MTGLDDVPYAGHKDLENRWTDVFRRDTFVHLGVMASIVAGTFQGYLKDRIAGPLPYALAELFFIGAVVVWFGTLAVRHQPIRGPGMVPGLILLVILVPTLYLLHPGTPLVVELAGLRGWAEFPVACLVALTIIRTPGQLRAYVGLVLILCVITALYGLWQYRAGPESILGVSELARIRHGQRLLYSLGEAQAFRVTSTFTLPATFAALMTFGIFLSAGIATSRVYGTRKLRAAAVLVMILCFLGIVVSGTRAAMVVTVLGLAVLAWYRGLGLPTAALGLLVGIALYLGTVFTAGQAAERFQSVLLDEGLVWTRIHAPISIAFHNLADFPFGLGLGRSAVGVPFAIVQSYPAGFFRGSDGDIGRAAVEMGIFGVLLLSLVMIGLLPYIARAVGVLRRSASQDLALGIGAMGLSTGIMFLVGTPLSSVPQATIWWFLVGGLFKLWILPQPPLVAAPERS